MNIITALILERAGVEPPEPIDGLKVVRDALQGGQGTRDHATVDWDSATTVVAPRWWFNCKVDGTGVILHDLEAKDPWAASVA